MIDLSYEKPEAQVVGQDGNVFNVIGIAQKAMRKAGATQKEIKQMQDSCMSAESYNQVLGEILPKYVDLT